MDNLTHSLFGLTLARTPLSRSGRGTTAALLLASNAPDIDVVVTAGGTAKYLQFHRGPTHGLLGIVGLSLVVAAVVRAWTSRRPADRDADPPASFAMLWIVSAMGVLCHILMDLPTSYGTRMLSPFAWTWFSVDWMPIVDIYLLAIFAAGFWFARGGSTPTERHARRRRNAALVLMLMAVNYGVRAVSHHTAIARAPEVFSGRLPQWCDQSVRPGWAIDHWPRLPGASPRETAASRCLVELAAMPDFISPFRWRMIAQTSNGYELRDLDLLSGDGLTSGDTMATRMLSVRYPNQWTSAVVKASTAPVAQVFLGFSRFPAARSFVAEDGTATVHWNDLRFTMGPLDSPRQLRGNLFAATVILAPDGSIRVDRLGTP